MQKMENNLILVGAIFLTTQFCCKMNHQSIKQGIIEKIKPQNELYARLLADEHTKLNEVKTDFLNQYKIYRAEYFSPSKPVIFYIAYKQSTDAMDITGQPDQFMKLALKDHILINSAALSINYIKTFFEITRSASSLSYIIESPANIKFKPNLSDADQERKKQFLDEFGAIIHPPESKKINDEMYSITYFVVTNQQLEKHKAQLDRTGTVTIDKKVIATDIPTVYGL